LVYDSAPAEVDDLKLISGVGPVLEEKLNSIGVFRFEQIATWSKRNVQEFDELLSFKGRIDRDEWIKQATALQEEKYGK
jgi:predicted flap endonuclease-1-like 5' DNA nuclease